ncbi:MAG: NAD(P)-dependent oxidoreductase [Polaromonas sp.]|nr:NAD(P)-dependent oxidoreductase [Polaromonas sp.]
MARAIGQAGFKLHVYARRALSLGAVEGVAHTVHASVASLAKACNIVALCLTDDKDVWRLLDDQGLLAALAPGAVVINHGTGEPGENARLAAYLAEAGVRFLDAPVSGGRAGAVARTLTTFVGGDRASFEQCLPVLQAFSRRIANMGPAGSGQLTKLLNNALTLTNLKNAVDVLSLADKLAINVPALYDVVSVSSGSSAILEALKTFTPELAAHLQGLMRKDIGHFADAIRHLGLDPTELHARGLGGASGLVDTVRLITESQCGASSLLIQGVPSHQSS